MIELQIRDKNDFKLYTDNEKLFKEIEMKNTLNIRKFIQDIDFGVYLDDKTFKDRFGNVVSLDFLSTGCKTAIIVELCKGERVIDTAECGHNAISLILALCREGKIIIQLPKDEYFTHRGDGIDVSLDGYRFTSMKRLNHYLLKERRITADMSIAGVEKLTPDGKIDNTPKKKTRKLTNKEELLSKWRR